jgi:hypothetical protein
MTSKSGAKTPLVFLVPNPNPIPNPYNCTFTPGPIVGAMFSDVM